MGRQRERERDGAKGGAMGICFLLGGKDGDEGEVWREIRESWSVAFRSNVELSMNLRLVW